MSEPTEDEIERLRLRNIPKAAVWEGNVPGCPPCDCCTPEQREAGHTMTEEPLTPVQILWRCGLCGETMAPAMEVLGEHLAMQHLDSSAAYPEIVTGTQRGHNYLRNAPYQLGEDANRIWKAGYQCGYRQSVIDNG